MYHTGRQIFSSEPTMTSNFLICAPSISKFFNANHKLYHKSHNFLVLSTLVKTREIDDIAWFPCRRPKFLENHRQKQAQKRKHSHTSKCTRRNYAITSCIPAVSSAFAMRFGQRRRNNASGMLLLMDVSDTRQRRRENEGARNGVQIGIVPDEGTSPRERESSCSLVSPAIILFN